MVAVIIRSGRLIVLWRGRWLLLVGRVAALSLSLGLSRVLGRGRRRDVIVELSVGLAEQIGLQMVVSDTQILLLGDIAAEH